MQYVAECSLLLLVIVLLVKIIVTLIVTKTGILPSQDHQNLNTCYLTAVFARNFECRNHFFIGNGSMSHPISVQQKLGRSNLIFSGSSFAKATNYGVVPAALQASML